ncbi:hypothetical protein D3C87_1935870 [compost metagenome]
MTTEVAIQTFKTSITSECLIDLLRVDDHLMHQLPGKAIEPFTLHRRPLLEGVDFLHGIGHPLIEWQQGFADSGLANVADDAGSDFLVGLVTPCAFEADFAKTVLIEQ